MLEAFCFDAMHNVSSFLGTPVDTLFDISNSA